PPRWRADDAGATMEAQALSKETMMAKALEVTDQNFADEVLAADKPVLVDFWAPWCPPCRQMGPVVDEIAGEVDGEAIVAKLNVDDNPATAAKYGVSSIPRFIMFKDGE